MATSPISSKASTFLPGIHKLTSSSRAFHRHLVHFQAASHQGKQNRLQIRSAAAQPLCRQDRPHVSCHRLYHLDLGWLQRSLLDRRDSPRYRHRPMTMLPSRLFLGRHIYAVGGNPEAAELSGISVKKITFTVFGSMGFLTALSGILFTSRTPVSHTPGRPAF